MTEQIGKLIQCLELFAKRVSEPNSKGDTLIPGIEADSPFSIENEYVEYVASYIGSQDLYVAIKHTCLPGVDHSFKLSLVKDLGEGKVCSLVSIEIHFNENDQEPEHGIKIKVNGLSSQGFDLTKLSSIDDFRRTMAFARAITNIIETLQIAKNMRLET